MKGAAGSYDPSARRKTPLAIKLTARIQREGPIPVAEYMRACLYDPEHGYYVTRPAIGAAGDFVTAPEISQIFGELVGLWSAVVWQQMGQPRAFDFVEYGPGRGTLMADALRAVGRVPGFLNAARVRLVEVSPVLRQAQRDKLAAAMEGGVAITWHERLMGEVEPAPSILIANEVLDAAVVDQFADVDGRVGTRCVGLDGQGGLEFCVRVPGMGDFADRPAAVTELRELHGLVAHDMAALPVSAALLIDYGHAASRSGDTLQAVRNHAYEHPLTSPGEADLTAQVDFELLVTQCREAGFVVDGPRTQAEFLSALGLAQRASRLMAANPALAGQIEAGVARLMSPTGMGTAFKAIGVRSPTLPPLPGLSSA